MFLLTIRLFWTYFPPFQSSKYCHDFNKYHFSSYGIFAKRDIFKGEFIASYEGERISISEGEKQLQGDQDSIESQDNLRRYLYFVKYKSEQFW